jgi:hypothetical protein
VSQWVSLRAPVDLHVVAARYSRAARSCTAATEVRTATISGGSSFEFFARTECVLAKVSSTMPGTMPQAQVRLSGFLVTIADHEVGGGRPARRVCAPTV